MGLRARIACSHARNARSVAGAWFRPGAFLASRSQCSTGAHKAEVLARSFSPPSISRSTWRRLASTASSRSPRTGPVVSKPSAGRPSGARTGRSSRRPAAAPVGMGLPTRWTSAGRSPGSARRHRPRNEKSRPEGRLFLKNWQRPTLPGGCPPSTIGAERLNGSVRNGKRCFPLAIATKLGRPKPRRA
jgi:hypothetical protein